MDRQIITDALDKLAAEGSADQIADRLAELGHIGKRRAAQSCPVSNYLFAETGERISVSASIWEAMCGDLWRAIDWNPKPIEDFVDRFDRGHYPNLMSDGA